MAKKHNRQRIPKVHKGVWFVKVRGSYLPASWQGWLTYIPFIGFLVAVLAASTDDYSSLGTAIYRIFPEWIAAAVVMTWFASRKS